MVGLSEEVHLIVGDESHIVKRIEGINGSRLRLVLGVVVHEPASGIVVEVVGKDIKEGLRECENELFAWWHCMLWVTYCIHACDDGEVLGGILLGGEKEAHALSSRDVDHLSLSGLGVDTVDLHNAHLMTLEPEVLAGKGTHVDGSEQVRRVGLDRQGVVGGLVHEGVLRNGLSTGGIGFGHELGNESMHLLVIPVGKSKDELLVILILVGKLLIVDNEGTAQAVGVLSAGVRVVPVGSGLVNLLQLLVH